jgi:hypothetical protein
LLAPPVGGLTAELFQARPGDTLTKINQTQQVDQWSITAGGTLQGGAFSVIFRMKGARIGVVHVGVVKP